MGASKSWREKRHGHHHRWLSLLDVEGIGLVAPFSLLRLPLGDLQCIRSLLHLSSVSRFNMARGCYVRPIPIARTGKPYPVSMTIPKKLKDRTHSLLKYRFT